MLCALILITIVLKYVVNRGVKFRGSSASSFPDVKRIFSRCFHSHVFTDKDKIK